MAGRLNQRIHLSPRKRLANATKRSPKMNDPEIIEYLQGRIKELEKEAKESIPIHGMPSYPLHRCYSRINALEEEIKILANKGRKQRQKNT